MGLAEAIMFRRFDIDCIVLEKYPRRLVSPKAHAINPRSLEILRQIGLDTNALRRLGTDESEGGYVWFLNTLTGTSLGSMPYERQDPAVSEVTPEPFFNIPQPDLEDFFRKTALQMGVRIFEKYEWISREGAKSMVRNRETSETIHIESKYLIACDGARSTVRQLMQIPFDEKQAPAEMMTFHFDADITSLIKNRRGALYFFLNPIVRDYAVIVSHRLASNHVLVAKCGPGIPFDEEYFTEERSKAIINTLLGTDSLPYNVIGVKPWYMSVNIARTYRSENVFLVGDAAHAFPPTGGLGLNTGIADAHNLAWKIAAVERHLAPPTFLDTYEEERQAIAHVNADQSAVNRQQIGVLQEAVGTASKSYQPVAQLTNGHGNDASPSAEERATFTQQLNKRMADPISRAVIDEAMELQRDHFDSLDLQLGYIYGKTRDLTRSCQYFSPSAETGARLPHAPISVAGNSCSTLDLVDLNLFTLIVTSDSAIFPPKELSSHVLRKVIDTDFLIEGGGLWLALAGIDRETALLVRPDQHILGHVASSDEVGTCIRSYFGK